MPLRLAPPPVVRGDRWRCRIALSWLMLLAGWLAVGNAAALEPIPDRLVVLTFDDAARSHYEVARPLLKAKGFGATFFISEGWDFATNKKDYMTWEQIRALHDDGFEIGNHTLGHVAITPDTVGDLPAQVRALADRCGAHGIPVPTSFGYPGNAIIPEALPVLAELGIRFARRGGAPEFPYEQGRGSAYEPGRDHPLLLPSAGDARPTWSVADLDRAVLQARDGRIAVLQFHGVPDTAHAWVNTDADRFARFVDRLAELECTVIAVRDLARYVDADVAPADPLAVIEERKVRIARGDADDPPRQAEGE